MKNLTLIYCGEDGAAARELADKLRDVDNDVAMCSTEYFVGAEIEAARVIIMPDVPFFRAMPVRAAYPTAEYTPGDFTTAQVRQALQVYEDFSKTIKAPPKKRGRPRKVIA